MHQSRKARPVRWLARLAAAVALLVVTAGAASASEPDGRAASANGLAVAFAKITFTDLIVSGRPLEQISIGFERALDPEQPGVNPGDGSGDAN